MRYFYRKYTRPFLILASLLLLWAPVSPKDVIAGDVIDGLYVRKNNLSTSWLRVHNCGGGKGILIEKSTHKPSIGKVIMCGAKKSGNSWKGKILNLEDNKKYSATISTAGNRLKIRGCALGGLVCQNNFFNKSQ